MDISMANRTTNDIRTEEGNAWPKQECDWAADT
jgi:hypothetical protein